MMHGVYRIKQCFCYTETSNTKYLYANEKSDKSPVEHIHYVTNNSLTQIYCDFFGFITKYQDSLLFPS